jgi:hypothetical protein
MLETIENIHDENMLTIELNELTEHYTQEFKIQPLVLYLGQIYETLAAVELQRYYHMSNKPPYGAGIYTVDGYRISYHIPFSGDNRLLYLYPVYAVPKKYEIEDIVITEDSAIRTMVFSLEYTKDELGKKVTPEFKSEEFLREFKRYIEIIDEINKRVEEFNIRLPVLIKGALIQRKQNADEYLALRKTLSIPLERNPNAPNTIPIPLKKVQNINPKMTGAGQLTAEYTISNADYKNIRRIIGFAGFSMEKTAATFNKLNEDSLRDVMVAFLNTHYLGTATGEAFCKTGRADIHILFENKAAYIAECKIWRSEECLKAAIGQIFNYTTWRDVKTSIIIFNKDSKYFQRLLSSIDDYLKENKQCQTKFSLSENEWLCTFKQSSDAEDSITIHIIAFNLYLKPARKNKDKRITAPEDAVHA